MRITVTTLEDDIFVLELSDEVMLGDLKVLCELESRISKNEILIIYDGQPLVNDSLSLKSFGLKDGDVVVLQRFSKPSNEPPPSSQVPSPIAGFDFSSIQLPSTSRNSESSKDVNFIRDSILADPERMASLKRNNPTLADAIETGNINTFSEVLTRQMDERKRKEINHMRIVNADPFDAEAQRLIAEEITQNNIDANMEAAFEYSPESFGSVVMLYINCKVNGVPVKAFIDSGAQATIMSVQCAERCSIMRLVDKRFGGIAKGIGTSQILGRIHMMQVAIENDFFTTSLSILVDQSMDMLLGLDMLRRHQCCIDLRKNVLRIGTTGTETAFLSESEVPHHARLTLSHEADQGQGKVPPS